MDDIEPPTDDEDFSDFMDRCMESEDADEDACLLAWQERSVNQ